MTFESLITLQYGNQVRLRVQCSALWVPTLPDAPAKTNMHVCPEAYSLKLEVFG